MFRTGHILVVDDDADFRDALALLLEANGDAVQVAGNGRAGLEALAADDSISLVVLDHRMPEMDGASFLEHKAHGAHAATPVVVFSASDCAAMASSPDVAAVISKLDGAEPLLAAARIARGAGLRSARSEEQEGR